MMRESIEIRNLGPLREVEIADIRPMTVIIGESGSGKSLFMKTLILFRYIYKMLNIRWYLRNSNITRSRFKLAMSNLLSSELKFYFANYPVEVVYRVEINGRIHSVEYRDGKIDRTTTDAEIPNDDLVFFKESWISESRGIIPQWVANGNNTRNAGLDFYFQETFNDFQAATEVIDNVDLGYLGLSLEVVRRGNNRKYFVRPLNDAYGPLEWRYGSSGAQSSSSISTLISYFSSVFSFKDAISRSVISYLYEREALSAYQPGMEPMDMKKVVHVHVEEPELNLFPNAQCALIDSIVRSSFNSNSPDREMRLMLTTHSPYIVNYLNILIHQTDESKGHLKVGNLGVYRIYEGRLQSLIAVDEKGDTFVDTSDLTDEMVAIMQQYEYLTESK